MLAKKSLDGHVESILLSLLNKNPNYGYRIVRELNELAPEVLKMGEGTVYPVLHRMEERGMLKGVWEENKKNRPRKYYHVTRKGKRHMSQARQQWIELQKLMRSVFEDEQPNVQGKLA